MFKNGSSQGRSSGGPFVSRSTAPSVSPRAAHLSQISNCRARPRNTLIRLKFFGPAGVLTLRREATPANASARRTARSCGECDGRVSFARLPTKNLGRRLRRPRLSISKGETYQAARALPSITFTSAPLIGMRRGFCSSGTIRSRSTWSKPFSSLAPRTSTFSASWKRRSNALPAIP